MSHYIDSNLSHKEHYDEWAPSYNKDVAAKRQYEAPQYIADFLFKIFDNHPLNFHPYMPEVKVLDIGCGTGLVGEVLHKKGIVHIDGVDLSHKMVEEAQKTGAYQTLIGWCNIRQKLPFFLQNQYDLTISCGVFTLNLVLPVSLAHLIQVTKRGGIIVIGTRTEWYDTYNFEGYYKKMIQQGHIKLIDCSMNAPYAVGDFNAHYWAFLVVNNQIN